jgi:hypothetical protein
VRYSDENQQGLLSLLAASQQGLDPTTAYGMLQDIQGDQESLNAQRQERQSGLIGMLMEAAQGGMPYAGAEALLDAAPGPMGPALQSALGSLYGDQGGSQVMHTPEGGALPAQPTGLAPMPGSLSPTFQPPQPSISDQQAVMEMEQQQVLDADLTALQADAAQARAQEWTADDYIARATAQNPELFATAPEEAMAIIENTFGSAAIDMRGAPGIG